MQTRWKVIGGMALGAALWLTGRGLLDQEPRYEGLTADAWLRQLMTGNPREIEASEKAFLAMGHESYSTLRKALGRRDSHLKQGLMFLEANISFIRIAWVRDYEWRHAAIQALSTLGTNALPVLPEFLDAVYDDDVPLHSSWVTQTILAMGLEGIPGTAHRLLEEQKRAASQSAHILRGWEQVFDRHSIPSHLRPTVLEPLLATLRHPSSEMEAVAACRLAQWYRGPDSPVIDPLIDLLMHPRHSVRYAAITCLRFISPAPDHVAPSLMALLQDDHAGVRVAAVKSIPSLGLYGYPALPTLGEMLVQDEADSVRIAALYALGEAGSAASRQLRSVAQLLNDPSATIRALAARTLIQIRTEADDTVPVLVSALRDDAWEVQCAAAESLGKLGEHAAPAVSALAGMLINSRESVQITAVEALGRIGPAAKPVIPDLYLAWNNNQSALGPHVKRAIEAITEEQAP